MADEPAPPKRRRIFYRPERENLADHFVAGLVSAIVMFGIVMVAPLIAFLNDPRIDPFEIYLVAHIWAPILLGTTFLVGLVVGPKKMAELWGHLWGTEDPDNEKLGGYLWSGIFLIIFVTWLLM